MTWRFAAALSVVLAAACHRATVTSRTAGVAAPAVFAMGWSPDSLFYRIGGRGEAIVLLHAFSVDGRMWDSLATALAPRYRVIVPDLRGHGRTRPSSDAYSSHEDIARLLDALNIQRAALVGLSYGSQVAVDFAIAYPDRATALALASTSVSGYVSRDPMTFMAPGPGRWGRPGGDAYGRRSVDAEDSRGGAQRFSRRGTHAPLHRRSRVYHGGDALPQRTLARR